MILFLSGVVVGAFGMWILHWIWDVYCDHRTAKQFLRRLREDEKRETGRRSNP